MDSAAIAIAGIEMLKNPEKSQAMGASGREWIIQNWRWQIWADEFIALLNK
jgi:phosphatidylinositol alpha-1,6-mannosyltransferase